MTVEVIMPGMHFKHMNFVLNSIFLHSEYKLCKSIPISFIKYYQKCIIVDEFQKVNYFNYFLNDLSILNIEKIKEKKNLFYFYFHQLVASGH